MQNYQPEFKKGKSRPVEIDWKRQIYVQSLHSVKLIKKINNFPIIINIGETLFF